MKRLLPKLNEVKKGVFMPVTLVIAAFFLCGSVVGSAAAFRAALSGNDTLYDLMSNGIAAVGTGFAESLFNVSKFHLLTLLVGFSCFGVALIPLIAASKGFFLAFAVSSMYRISGARGLIAACCAFGIQNAVAVPCLMAVASQAFSVSAAMLLSASGRRKIEKPIVDSGWVVFNAMILAALFAAALAECYISPLLLNAVI